MVSSIRVGRNVNYRILDIDWCTSDKVVLASDDGCVRVLEMAMKSASYRMDEQDLTGKYFLLKSVFTGSKTGKSPKIDFISFLLNVFYFFVRLGRSMIQGSCAGS